MDFDAEIVGLRMILCEPQQQIAVAEADLEAARRAASE